MTFDIYMDWWAGDARCVCSIYAQGKDSRHARGNYVFMPGSLRVGFDEVGRALIICRAKFASAMNFLDMLRLY